MKINLPHQHGEMTKNTEKFLEEQYLEHEIFINIADMLSLISDSTRLKILWLLCHCEDCVINIAAAMEMSSPAVSHHLRILKQGGIIASRKEGKTVYYRLADTKAAKTIHHIIDDSFNLSCEV